jgi:ketosteroid isomerase-like protein
MADPPSSAETTEAAQSQIRSALENWRVAFNDRNERKVCDLFAPDLIANYQGQPERDFGSLCELLQTALQDWQTTYRYSLRVDEILVYSESAVARLVWTLEVDRAGAAKEVIEEPSVDIFRHQADGSWKISRYLAYPATR